MSLELVVSHKLANGKLKPWGNLSSLTITLSVCFFVLLCQLEFSDDIVRVIQTAINNDGGQPESRKANSMVKSFFIRVRT